jgi:hypothetical protein
MPKNITAKDVVLFIKQSIRRTLKNIWPDLVMLWCSIALSMTGALVIRDGGFTGFTTFRIIAILIFSLAVSLINYFVKEKVKKKELREIDSKLDIQYDLAFRYSSMSIFTLFDFLNDRTQTKSCIEDLLFNVSEIGRIILEANLIDSNSITANLMTVTSNSQSQQYLEIIAFSPKRPGRKKIKLLLSEKDPLPGAPTSFINNTVVYISDVTSQENKVKFDNKEYKSFVSIPISENEDDGNRFAILNIDSPVVNQFESEAFFNEKIYPALKPIIALIKVLHKTGRI